MPDSDRTPGFADRVERRQEAERRPTFRLAQIVLTDDERIPCVIRDISARGAKLGVSYRYALPETFFLRAKAGKLECRVQRVWRRGDYAGVLLLLERRPPAAS